jgi:hypothetical protein
VAGIFDVLSLSLFFATVAMFVVRVRHEDPPFAPYILIALSCAAGNWLGEEGSPELAVALLISGAFLLLHIASLPYPEEGGRQERR